MPKPTPRPPRDAKAILKDKYHHLRDLDAAGWHDILTRIYTRFMELGGLGIAQALPNVTLTEEDGKTVVGTHHVPTVQIVLPRKTHYREPNGREVLRPAAAIVQLEPNNLPAAIVNFNAPDAVIFAEFKRALKEVREIYPPPVEKPGRAALNGEFDARIFAKWRQQMIVPMAWLLVWRAGLDKPVARAYRDRVIGSWLGFANAKETSKAKATLKKALATLPALTAQINQDRDRRPNKSGTSMTTSFTPKAS